MNIPLAVINSVTCLQNKYMHSISYLMFYICFFIYLVEFWLVLSCSESYERYAHIGNQLILKYILITSLVCTYYTNIFLFMKNYLSLLIIALNTHAYISNRDSYFIKNIFVLKLSRMQTARDGVGNPNYAISLYIARHCLL